MTSPLIQVRYSENSNILQKSDQQTQSTYKIKLQHCRYLWINIILLTKYNLISLAKIQYRLTSHQQISICIYLTVKHEHQKCIQQMKTSSDRFGIIVEQIKRKSFQKQQSLQNIQEFFLANIFSQQDSFILNLNEYSKQQKQFLLSQIHTLKVIKINSQQLNQHLFLTYIDQIDSVGKHKQKANIQQVTPEVLQKLIIPSSFFIDLIDKDGKALDDYSKDLLIGQIEKIDQMNIKHAQFGFGLVNDSIQCYIQIKFIKTKDDVAFIKQLTQKINKIVTNINFMNLKQSNIVNIYQDPNQKQSGYQLHKSSSNDKLDKLFERCIIKGERMLFQNIVSRIYDYCDINVLRTFWNVNLRSFLTEISREWNIYKFQYGNEIKKLIQYLQYALQKYKYRIPTQRNKKEPYQNAQFFNVLDIVCPDMAQIVNNFEKKLRIKSLKAKIKAKLEQLNKKQDKISNASTLISQKQREIIEQCLLERQSQLNIGKNVIDKLIYNYFKQIEENNIPQKVNHQYKCFYVKAPNGTKIPLKKYISQIITFQRNSKQWIDVFKLIEANYKIFHGKRLVQKNYSNQLQYQRLPNINCLGCTTFFLSNMDVNNESDTNVSIKVFDSVFKLNQYEVRIKQQFCHMLNNHGGIILFDCFRQCNSIYTKGASINQKDKEMIQNKINAWITSFYPKIQIRKNINLSFVPVYQRCSKNKQNIKLISYCGSQNLKKPNQLYYEQSQQEGFFVFRIKVTPHDQKLYYFWQNIDKDNHSYFIYEPKHDKKYLFKQLHKLIKKKYKIYRQNNIQNPLFATNIAFNPLNHICSQPEAGEKTNKKSKTHNLSGNELNPEMKYKFMSLVFTRHQNMQKVKSRFFSNSIKCQYEQKFHNSTKYKLKASFYSSILYHDEKLQNIIKLVHNNLDYYFDSKPIIIISITNFIKIQNQKIFSKEQFRALCEWVKIQFSDETIEVFQFKNNNNIEHYIKSQTKTSTVFLYFLLKEYNYKITLKNPLHIDRLNAQQKAKVWRKIYTNDPQNHAIPSDISEIRDTIQDQFQIQCQNHNIPSSSQPFLFDRSYSKQLKQQQPSQQDNPEFQRQYKQLQEDDYEKYYRQTIQEQK